MVQKKNLWFLTLFSLILVLGIYYVTMPTSLMTTNNGNVINDSQEKITIEETSLIETLKQDDNANKMDEINKHKAIISNSESTIDDKNKAFDAIKLLNQISSKEELLEEKIKNIHDLDSFIKIDGDQIRAVIDSDKHDKKLANDIMKTIQNNFETKQYISIQFK